MVKEKSRSDKIFLISMGILVIIGLFMPVIKLHAEGAVSKPDALNSVGEIEIVEGDNVARFNAEDLYWLYEYCK